MGGGVELLTMAGLLCLVWLHAAGERPTFDFCPQPDTVSARNLIASKFNKRTHVHVMRSGAKERATCGCDALPRQRGELGGEVGGC